MSRSRGWCFTLNNYSFDEENLVYSLSWERDLVYVVVGKEIGESGTPHLQGYIYNQNKKSLGQVKNLLERAHWEAQKGTFEQAINYCKKDGDYFEYGEIPKTPKQKGSSGGVAEQERWDLARKAAEEGRFNDIPSDIYFRFDVAAHRLRNRALQEGLVDLDGELEHEWWYGDPGTGKTSRARKEYPTAFLKDPKERWWDGYDGEEVVIIDDFDKYQIAQSGDMKRWLDRYVLQAPFKGGYMKIRPKKIIVTSNYHPSDIWDDAVTQKAILRRVKVVHFPSEEHYPLFVPTFNKL